MEERELTSPVSLLERTRQDFQNLLSDHLSSDDSTKSFKRRRRKTHVEEAVEMEAKILVTHQSNLSEGLANPALVWHEVERHEITTTRISEEKNENSQSSRCSSSSSGASPFMKQEQTVSHTSSLSRNKLEQSISQTSSSSRSKQEHSNNQTSRRSSSSSGTNSSIGQEQPSSKTHSSKTETNRNCCLSLLIHQTGHLVLEQSKSEMMVVVHTVNIDTGQCIVSPKFTTSWKASESNFSNTATWNQQLNFKFNVGKYLTVTLFLFEIVDKSFSHIAWAFLRPISRLGVDHCGEKLKLQLHHVPTFYNSKKPSVTDLFQWYQSGYRVKYPSVLYVTLELAGTMTVQDTVLCQFFKECRTDGQLFKIPNKLVKTVAAGDGALMSCFSDDGAYLAIGLTSGVIHVYEIAGSKVLSRLKGHRGNVYDLQWMGHSTDWKVLRLLSSGADCSTRVWNPVTGTSSLLPHPSFVYSSRFRDDGCVATACYDHIIRLWDISNETAKLMDCYSEHTVPINCICWDFNGHLYSGDAGGSILVWNTVNNSLQFKKTLIQSSDGNDCVNWICIHPAGTRLLVYYRGGHLCLIESKSGSKLMSYSMVFNPRLRLTCNISPCGSYFAAGSEDGSVHWFDLETGDLLAILSINDSYAVTSISFHSCSHTLVLCSLNAKKSFNLLEFDRKSKEVQGFSLTTFPRTVKRIDPSNGTTPTLNKLERIFRKLDLVSTWKTES